MELSAIDASLATQLIEAGKPAQLDKDLSKASQQFEAIFLRQFIGDALKPLLHQTPGSTGPGAQIYQHLVTEALAENLAQSEAFGFSSLLQMQLAGELPNAQTPGGDSGVQAPEERGQQ